MKYYSKFDSDVPMTYFYFYTYIRIPISLIISIGRFAEYGLDFNIFTVLNLFEAAALAFVGIGLHKRKYWGYVANKYFLAFEAVLYIISIFLNVLLMGSDSSGLVGSITKCVAFFAVAVPSYIYFEKRKYLFAGVPQQSNNMRSASPYIHACLIRILRLDGTVIERYEDIKNLNFEYSGFADESGVLYFREISNYGQFSNIVMTKEEWLKAADQTDRIKSDTDSTHSNHDTPPLKIITHTLSLSGSVTEEYENTDKFKFDYTKFLDENGNLYLYEIKAKTGTARCVTSKSKWLTMRYQLSPRERIKAEQRPSPAIIQNNKNDKGLSSEIRKKAAIAAFIFILIVTVAAAVSIVRSHTTSNPYAAYSCDISEAKYIGNANSGKFHKLSCKHLPDKANRIGFKTRGDAASSGMEPCKICNP